MHYLGPSGSLLMGSLERAASLDIGAKAAKRLTTTLLKTAFKAKIMHDEHLITRKDHLRMITPINALATFLLRRLLFGQVNEPRFAIFLECLRLVIDTSSRQSISPLCCRVASTQQISLLSLPSWITWWAEIKHKLCCSLPIMMFLAAARTAKEKLAAQKRSGRTYFMWCDMSGCLSIRIAQAGDVLAYYGGMHFLSSFFNSQEMSAERKSFKEALKVNDI